MNVKTLIAALVLTMSGPASYAALATCGSGSTFMSPGAVETVTRSFISAQSFSDCYSFTLGADGDVFGGTSETDPGSPLDIDVTSVTLSGGGLVTSLVDVTPGGFSFDNLVSGTYQLLIAGNVTGPNSGNPVIYSGLLTVIADDVAAVPEPATGALLLLAMTMLGLVVRRRREQV